ncbi:MAG: hypothetical protein FWD89_02240 [Firmicutes bacterium]|nr:hypothetical protein [Bacillota bacterium]
MGFWEKMKKVDDLKPGQFSLEITGIPTTEELQAIINFVKKVHNHIGFSDAEIEKEFLHYSCTSLAGMIFSIYKGKKNAEGIDCVEICTPYVRMDDEFCSHYAVRLNNTEPMYYFDISGKQTEHEIKDKMVKRWVAILKNETYGELPKDYDALYALTGVDVQNNYGCGCSSALTYIRNNIKIVPTAKVRPQTNIQAARTLLEVNRQKPIAKQPIKRPTKNTTVVPGAFDAT